jgi:serine/threonine protein kinase
VFEAFDHERQHKVALKVPHGSKAQAIYMFKQEFRTLADVTHPNLVNLFELLAHGPHWFFIMELVEGSNFYRRLRSEDPGRREPETLLDTPGLDSTRRTASRTPSLWSEDPSPFPGSSESTGWAAHERLSGEGREGPSPAESRISSHPAPPADYREVRNLFRQLAEGLGALHQAGELHRDIKPSNVLVTREGRVVLVDFGLAMDMAAGPVLRSEKGKGWMTGTPIYMAPEQIMGEAPSAASDWYSVGVMLYRALTGLYPFPGTDLPAIMGKLSMDPPSPASLVPGTPADLTDLCVELLSRNPEGRPARWEIREFWKGLSQAAVEVRELNLEELSQPAARKLAQAMLGPGFEDSEARGAWIARESGGNPYFIAELSQQALSERDFPGDPDRASRAGPQTLDQFIRSRVAGLGDESRQVLEALALTVHPVDWEILAQACGLDQPRPELLTGLRAAHFVRAKGQARNLVEIFHDRIRESVAKDIPGPRARKDIRLAMEHWSSTGFHIQHYNALVAQVNIHLYEGEPEPAWELITTRWRPFRNSLLLRVQSMFITMLELRARTALALAGTLPPGSRDRKACLKSAAADVSSLRREKTPYGDALALKLQAQESMVAARWPEAAALCLQAEIAFGATDMAVHAMAVRHVRSRLEGPPASRRMAEIDQWLRDQGVVQPERFVSMHVPVGLRSEP